MRSKASALPFRRCKSVRFFLPETLQDFDYPRLPTPTRLAGFPQ